MAARSLLFQNFTGFAAPNSRRVEIKPPRPVEVEREQSPRHHELRQCETVRDCQRTEHRTAHRSRPESRRNRQRQVIGDEEDGCRHDEPAAGPQERAKLGLGGQRLPPRLIRAVHYSSSGQPASSPIAALLSTRSPSIAHFMRVALIPIPTSSSTASFESLATSASFIPLTRSVSIDADA